MLLLCLEEEFLSPLPPQRCQDAPGRAQGSGCLQGAKAAQLDASALLGWVQGGG